MQSSRHAEPFHLGMEREIRAPREKVFEAWTNPQQLAKWLCRATPGHTTKLGEMELRVGGHLRLQVTSPDGTLYQLKAEFREIHPPERLVFTWTWEDTPDFPETLVEVAFRDLGQSTRVLLRHELFHTEEARSNHEKGWKGSFDTLQNVLRD